MLSGMNNPSHILRTLDAHLQFPVELTVYGRAAIALGFQVEPPFSATLDVDLIVPTIQVEAMDTNDDFWMAVDKTNHALGSSGLYLTHVFLENQVLLGKGWLDRRKALLLEGVERLTLFRPGLTDLVLTKMMRVDPEDRSDIRFLYSQSSCSRDEWLHCLTQAKIPEVSEIEEAFAENRRWFLEELMA